MPAVLGAAVVGFGIVLLIIGRSRYIRSRRLIDERTYRPAVGSIDISVALFGLAGITALAVVVLGRL